MVTVAMLLVHVLALVFALVGRKGLRFRILGPTQKGALLQQNRLVRDKEGNPVVRGPGLVYLPPPGSSLLLLEGRATVYRLRVVDFPVAGLNVSLTLVLVLQYTEPDKVLFSVEEAGGALPNPKKALALEARSLMTAKLSNMRKLEQLRDSLEDIETYVLNRLERQARKWGVAVKSVKIVDYQEPPEASEYAASRLRSQAEVENYQDQVAAQREHYLPKQILDTLGSLENLRVVGGDWLEAIYASIPDEEEEQ